MRRLFGWLWLFTSLLATACDTSGIREAYMALDADGNRRRDHFFTDTERIFCVAKVASGVDDLTVRGVVRATQLFDRRDGDAIDVDYYLAFADEAPGAGEDITVSFELERADSKEPYVAGRFNCELSLDGKLQETLPFVVNFACPEAPLVTGTLCEGFVVQGTQCPGAFDETCECESTGAWSCR